MEAFLGEGSNAVVWRASGPGRTAAALKSINLGGKLGLKEFRGIQRVKEIRHPHLLPITAFWLLDDQGDVMDDRAIESLDEHAHGRQPEVTGTLQVQPRWPRMLVVAMLLGDQNLLELLEEHQKAGRPGIPVDELLEYMEDAARGIDFLNNPRHDLGSGPVSIQHCDVKPQNIVLVGDSAMVCDFGLARVLGDTGSYRTIGPAGTPAYVAPECIQGADPSQTTDQYSLAITYVELRTGRLPFAAESLDEIYEAHTSGSLKLGALPAGEREVIRRATALDPDQRYPSTLGMVQALRRVIQQPQAPASEQKTVPQELAAEAQPVVEPQPVVELQAADAQVSDVRPEPPEAESPTPAAGQHQVARDTDQIEQSANDSKKVFGPPDGGPDSPKSPTHTLRVEPKDARVKVNGVCLTPDSEGRVEIPGGAETALQIVVTSEGYERFDETITISQLEWISFKIELRRDARSLVDRGMAKLERGEIEAARADFNEAVDLAPDLPEAYQGQVAVYDTTKRYRRHYAEAFNEEAHAHFDKGDYARAVVNFTQAICVDPELAREHRGRLLRNRAVAYRNQRQYDKAIVDYSEVIRDYPDFARAYHDRAMAYCGQGDYGRAIADFAQAVHLSPEDTRANYTMDHASAYRERGDRHHQRGDYDGALADYDEAIRIRPDWGLAYNQRARTHGARNDWQKAFADYALAVQLDPEYAHLYFYNSGSAHYRMGNYEKAAADLTAAVERKPDYGKAYRSRSRAYRKLGKTAEADADRAKADEFE